MNLLNTIIGYNKKEKDKEKIRKTIIINGFSYLAMFSMLFFGTSRLLNGEYTPAIVDYTIFMIAFANFLFFRIGKRLQVAAYVIVTLVFLLMLAIFAVIGKGGTGLYWYYVFPLFSIFLLGNIGGNIYSIILIILTALGLTFKPDFILEYPDGLLMRVVFTYSLVLALTSIYEYVRNRTQKAFLVMYEAKSNFLEETLQQKEEILSINDP